LIAEVGGGGASHVADDDDVDSVLVDGGVDAEAEDEGADNDAASGLLESLLQAVSGSSTTQTSTTHRRERAIEAVLHRR
jgi:hypothetical protein